MGAEALSEAGLRQRIIDIVVSMVRVKDQRSREVLQVRFEDTVRVAFDNESLYSNLCKELVDAGYVRREQVDERFMKRFDEAIKSRDIATLLELQKEKEDIYSQALQERVIGPARTAIEILRDKGGSLDEEMRLRNELRDRMKWIPGINITERTGEEIEQERAEAKSPLSIAASIRISMFPTPDEKVSMQDLKLEMVPSLTPGQIHDLLYELHMKGAWLPLPHELSRFFYYGVITEEALEFARLFLLEHLQKK